MLTVSQLKPDEKLIRNRRRVLEQIFDLTLPENFERLTNPALYAQAMIDQGTIDILAPGGNLTLLARFMGGELSSLPRLSRIRSGLQRHITPGTLQRIALAMVRMAEAADRNELPERCLRRPPDYGMWTGKLAKRRTDTAQKADMPGEGAEDA